MPPREVAGYELGRRLGSGSFGEVYEGRRGRRRVAVKLERRDSKRSQLAHEWKLYGLLRGCGVPEVSWFGRVGRYNALVMELLGLSLEDLFKRHDKAFSLKTVLMCGEQMIDRLQHCHSLGILHRDIKPNNFMIGRADSGRIYIADFGLSKAFLEKGQHVNYREGRKGLTGTARYTSINNHMGVELSRRDDLEAVGYVLLRMLRRTLPWQGIKADSKEARNQLIKQCKLANPPAQLCKGLPAAFQEYLETCRALAFDAEPPYEELKALMRRGLAEAQQKSDGQFDWSLEDASTTVSDSEMDSSSSKRKVAPQAQCRSLELHAGAKRHRSH